MKPSLEVVQAIIDKKKRAIELLNEVKFESNKLLQEFGEGRFDYEIAPTLNDNGSKCKYLKFELVDNIAALKRGETAFSMASFNAVSQKSQLLIRQPKSLQLPND